MQIRLPKLHAAQQRVVSEACRFNVLACGRRWGKTILGLNLAIREALAGYPVGWIGPNYKIVADAFRQCETAVGATAEVNRNERFIRTVNGGSVEFWSADSGAPARSRKFKVLIIDEAAWIPSMRDLWQNELRATLADFKGSAWFLSTPKGRNGFHELYMRGLDDERPDWKAWQQSTSCNPYIAESEIRDMRADMSELTYQQEVEARFINFDGTVFRRVESALWNPPEDLLSAPKCQPWQATFCHSIGVDWGRSNDPTVIAIATDVPFTPRVDDIAGEDGDNFGLEKQRGDSMPTSIVELQYLKNCEFATQRARLFAIWQRYGRPPVLCEENSIGRPTLEQLRIEGMTIRGFITTNSSKSRIVQDVALDLERGRLRLPNDPVLLGEMSAFEATQLGSGLIRYAAPPGQHDDGVIAVCLARHCLQKYGSYYSNPYWAQRKYEALRAAMI